MAISEDLNCVATLCGNVADAAVGALIALGPRPSDPAAASTWDAQDVLLKNKISTLNNLSSSISAIIVSNALQSVWPTLTALDSVTASAQNNVTAIKDISKAMAAVAAVISFGAAVLTLAAQSTPANAASLVSAFKNMVGSIRP